MANEGIRLPSDSTVASQKLQRGHGLPETKALPQSLKDASPVSPLLTVVLQSRPIIEGKNQSLYELVLQNDPKSAPPIAIQADTQIKPGTSLLLELDDNGQYRPVDKPTAEQLQKLVKLELEFWRAQLLPKAGIKLFPSLPSFELLAALAKTTPELAPLIKWLTQQPSQISGALVGQWLKEAAPLTTLRPWATAIATPTLGSPKDTIRIEINKLLTTTPSKLNLSSALTPLNAIHVADPRLRAPIGLMTPDFLTLMQKNQGASTTAASAAPLATNSTQLAGILANVSTSLQPTGSATNGEPSAAGSLKSTVSQTSQLQWLGQLFKVANSDIPTTSKALHFQYLPVRMTDNTAGNQTNLNLSPVNSSQPAPAIIGTTTAPNYAKPLPVITLTANSFLQNDNPKLASPANINTKPVGSTASSSTSINSAMQPMSDAQIKLTGSAAVDVSSLAKIASPIKGTPTDHQPLTSPATTTSQSTTSQSRELPLEMKLGQWLAEIDKHIAQNPTQAQIQLKHRASELLRQLSEGTAKVAANPLLESTKPSVDKEEPALLALRHWLDSAQARIQHAAVQTGAAQWAAPDTPVNQMHLPLIWLGLTSWADIEWWQEKPKKKDSTKKDQEQRRRWRMKIYLSLSPLADMCADIDWSSQGTNITFWSEDTATLKHMTHLMPALHSWTEGLGEKNLNTKHGMPKRRTQSDTTQTEQHLVDIRT